MPRRPPRPGPAPRRPPGYTLVELLTACALLGVLGAVAYPRLDTARLDADGAAHEVRVALQLAQRLAITQQATVVVGIDSATRRLRLLEDLNGNARSDAGERITWRALPTHTAFATPPSRVAGGAAPGAIVQLAEVVDGLPSVVFRRDGSASAPGELYLTARRHGVREWRAVQLVQATGRVEWWRGRPPEMPWRRAGL